MKLFLVKSVRTSTFFEKLGKPVPELLTDPKVTLPKLQHRILFDTGETYESKDAFLRHAMKPENVDRYGGYTFKLYTPPPRKKGTKCDPDVEIRLGYKKVLTILKPNHQMSIDLLDDSDDAIDKFVEGSPPVNGSGEEKDDGKDEVTGEKSDDY